MFTFNKIAAWRYAATLILTLAVSACVSNDLPYPWVQPNVSAFEVKSVDAEGHDLLAAPVDVDSASRTVTIYLTEWANIKSVEVTDWKLSDGSECLNPEIFDAPLNLSTPVEVLFELYHREYTWTICAVQDIERYFTVGSQIGSSDIDVENHTVTAVVPMAQPLDNIAVRTLQLAGPLAVMSPDIVGEHVDFTDPVRITVTEFGEDVEWTLSITQTDVSVELERADVWTNVAWLYAAAEVGKVNGFEYRRASADDWTVVPEEWITHDGGSFTGRLIHLQPETDYVARAVSDDEHSVEIEFTTGSIVQLPNSNFQNWWLDGKVWNPWSENGTPFWGTGNRGATTLGNSNTTPMADPMSETSYEGAELLTKFVGVGVFGKLAAGNLFAGDFVKVDGTNGILAFGREFTQRPTKLRARIKYSNVAITHASANNPNFSYMKGEPDTCIVWCALGDWDEPFEIRTKPSERKLFSSTDPGVIAYGQFQSGNPIDDYIDVTIDLDYVATNRVPKYILVTASASKYGDYFTGGNGSLLKIKSYELLYDY